MNYSLCTNPEQLALHDSYFESMEFKNGNLTLHNIQYGHVFTTPQLGISIGKGNLIFKKVYSFHLNSLEGLQFDKAFKDPEISIYSFDVTNKTASKNTYILHFGREFYNDLIIEAESIEFCYIPGDKNEYFVTKNY